MISELPDPDQASIALDLDDGLEPDEAAVLAVLLNPSLKALRAQRGVSTAELLRAGLLPDPSFTLTAEAPTGGVTQGAVNGYGLGVDWAISDLIGRSARVEAASAQSESADLEILWQESLLAGRVRGLVFGLGALRASSRILDEKIKVLEGDVKRVAIAVKAGQLTAVDLGGREANLAEARASRVQLRGDDAAVTLELATAIGFPPGTEIDVSNVEGHQASALQTLPELLEGLETRRLDLLALRRGYDSQEENVRAAILGQFPRLSIGPIFNRDTGDLQTLGLGLAIDLPFFDRNRGEIAVQRATRTALFAEYTARVHEALASIAQVFGRADSLRSQLAALHDQEAVHEALVARLRSGLDEGYVDVLSYDQARLDLFDLEITGARFLGELQASLALIDVLSGHPGGSALSNDEGGPEVPGSELR